MRNIAIKMQVEDIKHSKEHNYRKSNVARKIKNKNVILKG